jgi:hypothetical protein
VRSVPPQTRQWCPDAASAGVHRPAGRVRPRAGSRPVEGEMDSAGVAQHQPVGAARIGLTVGRWLVAVPVAQAQHLARRRRRPLSFFKNTRHKRNSAFSLSNRSSSARHRHRAPRNYRSPSALGRRDNRPSNSSPTPISAATCATRRPVSTTRRTACSRYSGVYFLRFPDTATSFPQNHQFRDRMSTVRGQPHGRSHPVFRWGCVIGLRG